ncbi:MAG: glucosyltransferase domain-containing protein [Lachnospiraceae bacterium]|nr:glucosyltransferase domain-containing protein [Lachnospiraceae bacterium]
MKKHKFVEDEKGFTHRERDLVRGKHMRKIISQFTVLTTLFFCLFAHGYRFANNILSHDALLEVVQEDSAWQIALGRIMHPVLILLRGGICSPWLICILETTWFILTVCFMADLFNIHSEAHLAALAGIVVCSHAFISTNAAFLQCADFYAFALFMSVLGVWLMKKGGVLKTAVGIICLVLCLGTYQAYICVTLALIVMLAIRKLSDGEYWHSTARNLFKNALVLFASAFLYLIGWKMLQRILGIWTADTYNGMAHLGDYSDISFVSVIITCYKNFLRFFTNPTPFSTMTFRNINMSILWEWLIRFVNAAIFIKLGINLYRVNRKNRYNCSSDGESRQQWICGNILMIFLIVVFPLCCNFVCLMSKGMEHDLMTFAFICPYILAIMFDDNAAEVNNSPRINTSVISAHSMRWFISYATSILLSVIIWSNVVYANQTYYKKSLQEQAAISLMTRIVNDIERHEGYIPGVTPVAFIGSFEKSPYTVELSGFTDITPYGMGRTALTYFGTDYAMLKYVINVNMNLTRVDELDAEMFSMPCYPVDGSINYIGDVLIIKISD